MQQRRLVFKDMDEKRSKFKRKATMKANEHLAKPQFHPPLGVVMFDNEDAQLAY